MGRNSRHKHTLHIMLTQCPVANNQMFKAYKFIQPLFQVLPVCFAAILCFRCRPMFCLGGSGISESGMVENVGVAAEIASPSPYVQTLFSLPVSSPLY